MAITREQLEQAVVEKLSYTFYKSYTIDKNLADYQLYNALVGTTFDSDTYSYVATNAPEYLYNHIPGGSMFASIATPEQVESHKGSTNMKDLDKYDLDKDGDIDDVDVNVSYLASEMQVETDDEQGND